jgi:hypothetical protein
MIKRKSRGVLRTTGPGRVMAGKSVSHHHRHSAWQRTALAKCKSVRKPHASFPDTPVDVTNAFR